MKTVPVVDLACQLIVTIICSLTINARLSDKQNPAQWRGWIT